MPVAFDLHLVAHAELLLLDLGQLVALRVLEDEAALTRATLASLVHDNHGVKIDSVRQTIGATDITITNNDIRQTAADGTVHLNLIGDLEP